MPHPSAPRVLLLDDEPGIRDFLTDLFEHAGFEAHQAEDGLEGVMKLRETIPNLIISDLEMPRMSGIEFISLVRRRFPQIPVIVISGAGPPDLPPEARPDACFQKGALSIAELLKSVRALVRVTLDRPYAPQVISTPIRTQRDGAGYYVLTCPDCLRSVKLMSSPEDKSIERTATCVYCQASLPYLVESSELE